jgi:hypothetical protein
MKNHLSVIPFMLLSLFIKVSYAQNYFQKSYYKSTTTDYGGQQTSDGGYILFGRATPTPLPPIVDMALVKIDNRGDTLWTKLYGDENSDEMCYSAKETYDHGFILTGLANSNSKSFCLLKTDSVGNPLWWKSYKPTGSGDSYSVIQTPDSGYMLLGTVRDNVIYKTIVILKTDNSGNVIWSRASSEDSIDVVEGCKTLILTTDGNYVAAAFHSEQNTVHKRSIIIKFNDNGDTIWSKNYSTSYTILWNSLKETLDGGYVLTGYLIDSSMHFYTGILRLDSLGNLLWSKKYFSNPSWYGYDLICMANGSFMLCGYRNDGGIILNLDSAGNIIFANKFSPPGAYYHFQTLEQTVDNKLAIFGNLTESFLFVKTNLTADSGCYISPVTINSDTVNWTARAPVGLTPYVFTVFNDSTPRKGGFVISDICMTAISDEIISNDGFTIYPNPSENILYVTLNSRDKGEVRIFNIFGQEEYTAEMNDEKFEADITQLSSGLHFIEVRVKETKYYRTFVKID